MQLSEHSKKVLLPLHALWFGALVWFACRGTWSWGATLTLIVWWVAISGLGIAVGYHRYFCHKSFEAHRPGRWLMLLLGSLAGQGSAVFWVALHLGYHHPHSDTPKDLHSPVTGRWNAYMGWMLKLKPNQVSLKAATSLVRDPVVKYAHTHYTRCFWLAYALLLAGASVAGSHYVLAVLTAVIWAIHQECAVNVINHTSSMGYRNFETKDNSVNNLVTGLLCFGQGWHNNHHAMPGNADFGNRWFEWDATKVLIPIVKARR